MPGTEPYLREAGTGPGVVCLHANASTSGQWRALVDRLAPGFHVLAPDSYGSGKSPEWPSDRVITLGDEVEFIQPALSRAGPRIALVGHSYGGAVALIAAPNVRRWAHALFTEPTPLSAFRSLDVPVLYMLGERSPRSARAVADLLVRTLPTVEVVEFEGVGHMGPLTHAGQVNLAIERFLRRVAQRPGDEHP